MLNFPKTGSSFARKAIKTAYGSPTSKLAQLMESLHLKEPAVREIYIAKIDEAKYLGVADQHGTWRQIPSQYLDRPVASVTRNPLSRYISTYHFGWWKRYPPGNIEVISELYPGFPDLSFEQYYEMIHHFGRLDRLGGLSPKIDLGLHTIHFIQFFFRDPATVLAKIDDEYIENRGYENDMADITFLEQDTLTQDLADFLDEHGTDTDTTFLSRMERVNVTKKAEDQNHQSGALINNQLTATIRQRDKLIFTLFPHYCDDEQV